MASNRTAVSLPYCDAQSSPLSCVSRQKILTRFASLLIGLLLVSAIGCGGGGGEHTVTPPPNPGWFELVASTTSVTLTPGSHQDVQVKANPVSGFSGTVTVTLAGLPTSVTATPATLNIPAGTAKTITLSAATSASESSAHVSLNGASGDIRANCAINVALTFNNAGFTPTTLDLPVLRIDTDNAAPIDSKDVYVSGHVRLEPAAGDATAPLESTIQIRGRGNSTWGMPKKPYKLKFPSKTSLLGMPADKEWALLANYSDKTLLRNDIAFELSRRVGMTYTPRSAYVEVYLNGEYEGTYQLTETIKIATNRVNIVSMSSTDISDDVLTGGYLLEVDFRLDGTTKFVTSRNICFVQHDPDPATAEQFDYSKNYVQDTEDVIYSDALADPENGYAKYVDTDSLVDWYLVNEIFKNNDAAMWSSVWMYKDRNKKMFFGPVWDFDLGAGNIDYNDNANPQGWWVRSGPWFQQLFKDPAFEAKVKARWAELKASQFDTLLPYIDQRAAYLRQAQQNNFQRWPILNVYVWPNAKITGSYDSEVAWLKDFLTRRIAWMDSQLSTAPPPQ